VGRTEPGLKPSRRRPPPDPGFWASSSPISWTTVGPAGSGILEPGPSL